MYLMDRAVGVDTVSKIRGIVFFYTVVTDMISLL